MKVGSRLCLKHLGTEFSFLRLPALVFTYDASDFGMDPGLGASPISPPAAALNDSEGTLTSPDISMLSRTGQTNRSDGTSNLEISELTVRTTRTSASREASVGAGSMADYVSNADSRDDILTVSDVDERPSISSDPLAIDESRSSPINLSPLHAAAPLAGRVAIFPFCWTRSRISVLLGGRPPKPPDAHIA